MVLKSRLIFEGKDYLEVKEVDENWGIPVDINIEVKGYEENFRVYTLPEYIDRLQMQVNAKTIHIPKLKRNHSFTFSLVPN